MRVYVNGNTIWNLAKMPDIVTAAMIVIGDEILSGRTKDRNIGHLADVMTAIGIDLKEVRIVSDDEDDIVDAVNAVRQRYTYVFTTGGIGPTHDDITADSISKAFGVPCEYDEKAMALLAASYATRNIEFNDARKRMARMPRGADAYRQPGIGRAGLSHRQRPRHGRRAIDLPGDARQCRADAQGRHQASVGNDPVSVRRRHGRRAARRDTEGPSRHDHRLLPEISGRQVLDGTRGAGAIAGGRRCRGQGHRGHARRVERRPSPSVAPGAKTRPPHTNSIAKHRISG